MTSNGIKTTSNESVKPKKNKLESGANIKFNDKYLNDMLHKINFQMDLAMQFISTDKTVRSDIVQVVKEFNSQSLATQAKQENY